MEAAYWHSSCGHENVIFGGPGRVVCLVAAFVLECSMGLKRAIQPMPDDIATRLADAGLDDLYRARPPYQRNDYLAWIARAKRAETREKRITQMLDELSLGNLYMKMHWSPKNKA